MNRAKMILSALGVLAVIASALAFKANNAYLGNLKCSSATTNAFAEPIAGNLCPNLTYTTTTPAMGAIRHCKIATASDATPCVASRVVLHP